MNQLKIQLKIDVLYTIMCAGISLSFLGCSNAQQKLVVIPLTFLEYVDTSDHKGTKAISKMKRYIVQGYKNNKASERFIDSFIYRSRDSNWFNYRQYQVIVYKESDETNVKNIEASPRVLVRYSQDHDWIYSYKWSDGQLLYKWKIKKGKIIKPKQNIKLEDIPN